MTTGPAEANAGAVAIRAAAVWSASRDRPQIRTPAPADRSAIAVASPIPRDPPVTIADLPTRSDVLVINSTFSLHAYAGCVGRCVEAHVTDVPAV